MKRIIALILVIIPIQANAWIHGKAVSNPAPVLSAPTANADGTDHALLGASTTVGSGTLYQTVSTSCGLSPTATQVKTGTVTGAVVNTNQAVSASGTQTMNPAGLTSATPYCGYLVQNTASGDSNVVATSSFTTGGTITFANTFTAAWTAFQSGNLTPVANQVTQALTDCFTATGNVTIAITFDVANLSSGGWTAHSNPLINIFSYATQIKPALVAATNQNSLTKQIFQGAPAADPTGLGDSYVLTNGNAAILGIGASSVSGGTLFLNNNSTFWDAHTAPSNCTGNGCAWGIILHEATEIMGRLWGQLEVPATPSLMEYSSWGSPTHRQTNGTVNHYPSVDGGVTNLLNPSWKYAILGDPQDWCTSVPDGCLVTFEPADGLTQQYSGAFNTSMSNQDVLAIMLLGAGLSHTCRLQVGL